MKTVHVDLGPRSYDIRIAPEAAPGKALERARVARALIVTDANVNPLLGDWCEDCLRAHGITSARCVLPPGESSKSLSIVACVYEEAVRAGLNRRGALVALGGGVVGDVAGFVAATYLRGVNFVQVPTTLLAMVDSSVGGKTGVNLPQGKNLVGAFYQPLEVTARLDALKTLSDREYAAGMAEVVKYGVIRDAALFDLLERRVGALRARDAALLEDVVARCCEIKAEVVSEDETESGVRAILNFGHTLGHAIEAAAGYGEWLHGEAVAAGMVYAARLSVKLRGFPATDARRLEDLLRAYGLPTDWRTAPGATSWADLRALMAKDKKTLDGMPRFVLADGLGRAVFGCSVPEADLEGVFAS